MRDFLGEALRVLTTAAALYIAWTTWRCPCPALNECKVTHVSLAIGAIIGMTVFDIWRVKNLPALAKSAPAAPRP